MTLADAFTAVILGVVEGLTEFLPISSTGHLIVAAQILGRDDDATDIFIVVIQLGAILAVCWHFHAKILQLLKTVHTKSTQSFVLRLFIAFLPAAIVGLLLHKQIKIYLFSTLTVAVALIIGGIIIIIIEKIPRKSRIENIEQMKLREALWVGIAQVFALFPGVSRAAATIMGGLLAGMSRKSATEFSFFLAIPVMFAASSFDLYQGWDKLSVDNLAYIGVGFVVAFISALFAIRWLLAFVATHDFKPFGWYRIGLGLLIIGAHLI